jgi:hypothetical protein
MKIFIYLTYRSDGIEETLLYEGFLYAILIAFPPPSVATAHAGPRPVHLEMRLD